MNWDKFFASPELMESAALRLRERSVRVGECMLWQGSKGSRGYGRMSVGKRNGEATHRVAWALENGQRPPTGMHVMHSCDTPACVNPEHLSVGTPKDNALDALAKGRMTHPHGSRHPRAKTTERALILAATLFAAGKTYRSISEKLGISRETLVKTLQGHRWPHIQTVLSAILVQRKMREAAK